MARVAGDMVDPAELVLVIIDAHPGLSGVVGTEEGLELVHLAGQVEGRIMLSRRGLPEAQRISFLDAFNFCEGQAAIGGMVETLGARGYPQIPFAAGSGIESGAG